MSSLMPPDAALALRLEAVGVDHADKIFADLQEPALYEFIADSPPATIVVLRTRYARLSTNRSPDGSQVWLNWVIWSPVDECFVGYLQGTLFGREVAEIAYVLFRRFWGRGYGQAAVLKMIEIIQRDYAVKTFVARVDTRNVRSKALLTALGFECVEIRPNAEVIHGVLTDEAVFRLRVND